MLYDVRICHLRVVEEGNAIVAVEFLESVQMILGHEVAGICSQEHF